MLFSPFGGEEAVLYFKCVSCLNVFQDNIDRDWLGRRLRHCHVCAWVSEHRVFWRKKRENTKSE